MSLPVHLSRVINIILIVKVSISTCAPKLGGILFDPLIYETKRLDEPVNIEKIAVPIKIKSKVTDRLKNDERPIKTINLDDIITPTRTTLLPTETQEKFRRQNDQNPATNPKKKCNGYDYDDTICKLINGRIQCGYDKNHGTNIEPIIDMGNGCRMRGKRVECGYNQPPYIGIRRPLPEWTDSATNNSKPTHLRSNFKSKEYVKENVESTSTEGREINKLVNFTSTTVEIIKNSVAKLTLAENKSTVADFVTVTCNDTESLITKAAANNENSTVNVDDSSSNNNYSLTTVITSSSYETFSRKFTKVFLKKVSPTTARKVTACVDKGDHLICFKHS